MRLIYALAFAVAAVCGILSCAAQADTLSCPAGAAISITCGGPTIPQCPSPPGVGPCGPVGSAPSGCTLSATPATIAAPQTVMLASSCSGGSAPTAWAWTGPGAAALGAGGPVAVAATSTYSVTPSNAYGAGNQAAATVTLTAPPPGDCPGFSRTVRLAMDWSHPSRMYTSSVGAFGPTDALVVAFTTGAGSTPDNNLAKIGGAEYGSTPSGRYAVLSATACDFGPQEWGGASAAGNTITVPFALGAGANFGYYAKLKNNTTYYLNVKNAASPACSLNGDCSMYIDLILPQISASAAAMVAPVTATTAAKAKAARVKAQRVAQ